MSMEYIRDYYNVPAKRGGRITYTDLHGVKHVGTITSAPGAHLRIVFDQPVEGVRRHIMHPTWAIDYHEDAKDDA